MLKDKPMWCAVGPECEGTPDRTVVWQTNGRITEFTHECRVHAIESATDPFAYDFGGKYRFAAVLAGIRYPF